jgi:glycosyltransferase involved in cell wall biosynthesis
MKDKMHVMHLRASNFVGGPERQILEHLRQSESETMHFSLCCFQENGCATELETLAGSYGLDCTCVTAARPFDLGTIRQLARIIRESKVDLLVTHGYKPNLLGRIASWIERIPTVAVSRGWTYESRRVRFYEFLDRIFLRLADAVVAVSEGQRQKILACGVRPAKVRVIHNAIDLTTYPGPAEKSIRVELGIPQDAILVATAGRLSPEKNHLGLVEAARLVLAKMPDVYFVVFGEGFLRPELEKAVADAGIKHRFLLPGFRSNVRSLLYEIDIFVLPSHTEGLPNVVLEAFACRKPVVATSVGGTPEVVQHGDNGILVPAGDMRQFALAVLDLVYEPDLRQKMGENGYEHVLTAFGYLGQTDAYTDIYSELLGKDVRFAEAGA